MEQFEISGKVKRFPGKMGWHYVELPEDMSQDFRLMIKDRWPALLGAEFTLNETTWQSSIMPIKDGPLFIALPAKVRKAEPIEIGESITISFKLRD